MLHDVGMIGVPDTILDKTDPLGDEEWEQLAMVPERGATCWPGPFPKKSPRPLRRSEKALMARPIHRRGRSSIVARILAVADAYDAMRTDKPYRAARGLAEAISRAASARRHSVRSDRHRSTRRGAREAGSRRRSSLPGLTVGGERSLVLA